MKTAYAFTGESYDPQTGLVYLRARYYQPYLNRFIQPDPILHDPRVPSGWNRYSYGRNNPLRYIDPSGMIGCESSDDPQCMALASQLLQEAQRLHGLVMISSNSLSQLDQGLAPVEALAQLADYAYEIFDMTNKV